MKENGFQNAPDDFLFLDDSRLLGYGESDSSGAWIKLGILPEQLEVFRGRKGDLLETALRIRDNDGTVHGGKPPKPEPEPHEYGDYAQALRLSGFMTLPATLAVLGTDAAFLSWLRVQTCAARGQGGCEGDVQSAHVRRVANGSGMAHKPAYSAVALCAAHHALQHQSGESALGGKEWFDKQREKYVMDWAWESLKRRLGVEHMYQASPRQMADWAQQHDLFRELPALIRHAAV